MSVTIKRILIFLGVLTGVFSANLGYLTHRQNLASWALLALGVLSAAAGAIHLGVTMVRRSIYVHRRDASLWLLLPGAILVGLGSPLEYLYLPAWLPHILILQIVGVVLSGLGLILAFLGGKMQERLPEFGDALSAPHTLPEINSQQAVWMSVGLWLSLFGIAVGYSSLIGMGGCLLLLLPGAILRHTLRKEYD